MTQKEIEELSRNIAVSELYSPTTPIFNQQSCGELPTEQQSHLLQKPGSVDLFLGLLFSLHGFAYPAV